MKEELKLDDPSKTLGAAIGTALMGGSPKLTITIDTIDHAITGKFIGWYKNEGGEACALFRHTEDGKTFKYGMTLNLIEQVWRGLGWVTVPEYQEARRTVNPEFEYGYGLLSEIRCVARYMGEHLNKARAFINGRTNLDNNVTIVTSVDELHKMLPSFASAVAKTRTTQRESPPVLSL